MSCPQCTATSAILYPPSSWVAGNPLAATGLTQSLSLSLRTVSCNLSFGGSDLPTLFGAPDRVYQAGLFVPEKAFGFHAVYYPGSQQMNYTASLAPVLNIKNLQDPLEQPKNFRLDWDLDLLDVSLRYSAFSSNTQRNGSVTAGYDYKAGGLFLGVGGFQKFSVAKKGVQAGLDLNVNKLCSIATFFLRLEVMRSKTYSVNVALEATKDMGSETQPSLRLKPSLQRYY